MQTMPHTPTELAMINKILFAKFESDLLDVCNDMDNEETRKTEVEAFFKYDGKEYLVTAEVGIYADTYDKITRGDWYTPDDCERRGEYLIEFENVSFMIEEEEAENTDLFDMIYNKLETIKA